MIASIRRGARAFAAFLANQTITVHVGPAVVTFAAPPSSPTCACTAEIKLPTCLRHGSLGKTGRCGIVAPGPMPTVRYLHPTTSASAGDGKR